ncbi:MAG: TrmH family RNA methyltransferase [Alphaproteobacteria bacterium]
MNEADRALIDECRRARRDGGLAVLDGLHALKHALRFHARIQSAWTRDRDGLIALARRLAPDIAEPLGALVEDVAADVFEALAPKAPETGVIAIAERPGHQAEEVAGRRRAPSVLLEDPAHLGNVGAVVRVAAAAGAAAVYTTGRHDPWDPAALRGSAGLHFALPVQRLDAIPDAAGPLIAIDPEGAPLRPEALPAHALLAFGSERRGLSHALLDRADQRLSLPMQPNVSSLNLATAVAAVLYAWRFAVER